MPLSPRAQSYLATLRRHPAVPVDEVAKALDRAGAPPYPAWLDFHERYAGFEEPLGRESAIFGIVHAHSYWLKPGEASVEKEDDGRHSVACAEVHGSFDYRLYEDGSFTSFGGGGPCETFDVKIEQNAAFREATSDGRRWIRHLDLSRVPAGGLDAFRAAVDAEPVGEATDRFAAVWRARDAAWLEGRGAEGTLVLWTPEDARDRISALLKSAR